MYSLNDYERAVYCDKDFYRLMLVVMIADSESYQMVGSLSDMVMKRAEFYDNH